MSFSLPQGRSGRIQSSRWPGAAFLVEAMLMVVFVAASLVVFTSLFASSAQQGADSECLADAVALASDVAERFAADPASFAKEQEQPDDRAFESADYNLRSACKVDVESRPQGTWYRAEIQVFRQDGEVGTSILGKSGSGELIYTLNTAAYVSAANAKANAASAAEAASGGGAHA